MAQEDSGERSNGSFIRLLQRAVEVNPREVQLLFLSGAYFFLVLTSYYIIRPIRDEMGVGSTPMAWD